MRSGLVRVEMFRPVLSTQSKNRPIVLLYRERVVGFLSCDEMNRSRRLSLSRVVVIDWGPEIVIEVVISWLFIVSCANIGIIFQYCSLDWTLFDNNSQNYTSGGNHHQEEGSETLTETSILRGFQGFSPSMDGFLILRENSSKYPYSWLFRGDVGGIVPPVVEVVGLGNSWDQYFSRDFEILSLVCWLNFFPLFACAILSFCCWDISFLHCRFAIVRIFYVVIIIPTINIVQNRKISGTEKIFTTDCPMPILRGQNVNKLR